MKPEVLMVEGNLLPFHFLRAGDRIGRAVVKIQRDDGATGTGFLVAPDILLTNHHVLPEVETAAAAVALANYEVNPPNDPAGRPTVAPLDPYSLFVTNADLDFTFCGVRGLEFLGAIRLERDQKTVSPNEIVNIIQHPRGRPKEVVLRDNRVVRADGVVLHYSCDTEPGSSGSPVFNNSWQPVALHHASVLTDSPEGRTVSGDDSGRYLNEGIRLSAIALWLDTIEASSQGRREHVARLRPLFGGLNATVGFFGALGQRAEGRTAPEMVADLYRERSDSVDVGYWNTQALSGLSQEFQVRVARVVAEMGLDFWCFTAADARSVEALCDQLRSSHGLEFRAIAAGDDQSSPVFLVRNRDEFSLDQVRIEPGNRAAAADPDCEADRESRCRPRRGDVSALVGETKLLVTRKGGGRVEFRIAIVSNSSDVAALMASDDGPSQPDRLLLGDSRALLASETLSRLVSSGQSVTAAGGDDLEGAVVWLPCPSSHVDILFASPNLRTVYGPSDLFICARDRELPQGLDGLPGPKPIALRLALGDANRVKSPSTHVARRNLDDDLDQRIRATLEPMLARLMAELRSKLSG